MLSESVSPTSAARNSGASALHKVELFQQLAAVCFVLALLGLAAYWLKQEFELAGVAKPEGSLWHAFRRRWATTRKHLPLRDVAAAGGWKDLTTLLTCYQQPDEETMRQVVDYERPAATGTRN